MQQPHPPIYVAGMSLETLGFAVERRAAGAAQPGTAGRAPASALARDRQDAEQAADLWRYSLNRYVFIGRTDAEAQARLDRALMPICAVVAGRPLTWTDPEAVRAARAALIRDQAIVGRAGRLHPRDRAAGPRGRDRASALRVQRARRPGPADHARQMELFAAEVLPACRAIGPAAEPFSHDADWTHCR